MERRTHVDHEGDLALPDLVHFNHGLAEIFNALWQAGMAITGFEEHRSVPWNAGGEAMEVGPDGEWGLREGRDRLPATYTLTAERTR